MFCCFLLDIYIYIYFTHFKMLEGSICHVYFCNSYAMSVSSTDVKVLPVYFVELL